MQLEEAVGAVKLLGLEGEGGAFVFQFAAALATLAVVGVAAHGHDLEEVRGFATDYRQGGPDVTDPRPGFRRGGFFGLSGVRVLPALNPRSKKMA